FFFSSRRRHTRCLSDWSSDVCSSDLPALPGFTYSTPSRSCTLGWCEWPDTTTRQPWLGLSSARSCSAWIATLPTLRFATSGTARSEEHTSELQSLRHIVCRLLLEKKK